MYDIWEMLENDLYVIMDWTKKWQMKIYTDKCKTMHAGRIIGIRYARVRSCRLLKRRGFGNND